MTPDAYVGNGGNLPTTILRVSGLAVAYEQAFDAAHSNVMDMKDEMEREAKEQRTAKRKASIGQMSKEMKDYDYTSGEDDEDEDVYSMEKFTDKEFAAMIKHECKRRKKSGPEMFALTHNIQDLDEE